MKLENRATSLNFRRLCLASFLAAILILSASCELKFLFVNQPAFITQNGTITYDVVVNSTLPPGQDPDNNHFLAIKIPTGFTVVQVKGSNTLAYNSGLKTWLDANYPAEPGYEWWVGKDTMGPGIGTEVYMVTLQANATLASYLIDYKVGNEDVYEVQDEADDFYLEVVADSDGDGLSDDDENFLYGTNPNNPDSDGDGMGDKWEVDYGLNPLQKSVIGTGTGTWAYPFYTFYHDARTQIIYLQSEIGGAGPLYSLDLNVATLPSMTMNNFTIRMKHTSLSVYPAAPNALWEGSGWTTVLQTNLPQGTTGWRTFAFTTPFNYNGVNNLMVDISFNNISYLNPNGTVYYSAPGGNRSLSFHTDSAFGDPLTWSGIIPNPEINTQVPNIRLNADADHDGLTNLVEFQAGTNPQVPDSDGDGVTDYQEVCYDGTCSSYAPGLDLNPNSTDTDDDDLPDGLEFSIGCLDPLSNDSDVDNLVDGLEDKNYNGIVDPGETDPCDPDSDNDSIPDGLDANPLNPDTGGDPDRDGLTDLQEYQNNCYNNNPDSDGDLMPDAWEVANAFNCRDAGDDDTDADGDGLTNLMEYLLGTDPHDTDTDNDGVSDFDEAQAGTDPTDPYWEADSATDTYATSGSYIGSNTSRGNVYHALTDTVLTEVQVNFNPDAYQTICSSGECSTLDSGLNRSRGNFYHMTRDLDLSQFAMYLNNQSGGLVTGYYFIYEGTTLTGTNNFTLVWSGSASISIGGPNMKYSPTIGPAQRLTSGKYYYIGVSWSGAGGSGVGYYQEPTNANVPYTYTYGVLETGAAGNIFIGAPPSPISNSYTSGQAGRIYQYLDFSYPSWNVDFFVYQNTTETGTYSRTHYKNVTLYPKSPTDNWYSSGELRIPLASGKYYYVGCAWTDYILWKISAVAPPQNNGFGVFETGSSASTGRPPAATINQTRTTDSAWAQIITTSKLAQFNTPWNTALVQDSTTTDPWSFANPPPAGWNATNRSLLAGIGLSYTVYNSASLGAIDLSAYDRMLVPSGLSSGFYTSLATSANTVWLQNAIRRGLTWDLFGWNTTAWTALLPTRLQASSPLSPTEALTINSASSPLVQGLTDSGIDNWNYSANAYYTQWGNTTTAVKVITDDSHANSPVLITYPWAKGGVRASQQTHEWWSYNYYAIASAQARILHENFLATKPYPACEPTEDFIGYTGTSNSGVNYLRGNIYQPTVDTLLINFAPYVNPADSDTFYWVVYEADAVTGPWTLLEWDDRPYTTVGVDFHDAPAPLNVPMRQGKYYYVASGSALSTVHYREASTVLPQDTSFGTVVRVGYGPNSTWPPPDSLASVNISTGFSYYQRLDTWTWDDHRYQCEVIDRDGDGVPNRVETAAGSSSSDPTSIEYDVPDGFALRYGTHLWSDRDDDNLYYYDEYKWGTSPFLADTDGDGLDDYTEVSRHTDPTNPDTDGDGLSDGWEYNNGTDPLTPDASVDSDGDGLTNAQEQSYGTNPLRVDTDGDGLTDFEEVYTYPTSPVDNDSDNDGLSDGQEILVYGTTATSADSDGDGVVDGIEVRKGTDPKSSASVPLWFTSISTNNRNPGTSGTHTVTGKNFQVGVTARLSGTDAAVTSVLWNPLLPEQLTLTINVPSSALAGPRDVIVQNPDGSRAVGNAKFTVSGPQITRVLPSRLKAGVNGQALTIRGSGFDVGCTLTISGQGADLSVTSYTRNSATQISATVSVFSTALKGGREITVQNPTGYTGKAKNLLSIYADSLDYNFDNVPDWSSNSFIDSNGQALSWGDVDGDGDLDLAVGKALYLGIFWLPAADELYLNNNGVLETTPSWISTENDASSDMEWGDIDNDGDLDLVVATMMTIDLFQMTQGVEAPVSGQVKVYYNQGGVLQTTPGWVSRDTGLPGELANGLIRNYLNLELGDVDNDGDLDLLAVDPGDRVYWYKNHNGLLDAFGTPVTPILDGAFDLELGDVDNDGDLDLVLSGASNRLQFFRFTAGAFESTPAWVSQDPQVANDIELADVNADGYLDIGVANTTNYPNVIYFNTGAGTFEPTPSWSSTLKDASQSVSFGDIDGDGDLDMFVTNGTVILLGEYGMTNLLYLNHNGAFNVEPDWTGELTLDFAFDGKLADVDGDGDLDYSVAGKTSAKIYLNQGGVLSTRDGWYSLVGGKSTGADVADFDNDGDLDVAVANTSASNPTTVGARNELLRNEAGTLNRNPYWRSNEWDITNQAAWTLLDADTLPDLSSLNGTFVRIHRDSAPTLENPAGWTSTDTFAAPDLAWGDVDNDGDLDLVLAGAALSGSTLGAPNRLYLNNNGVMAGSPAWTSAEVDASMSVAWTDMDRDGDLDLAVGNGSVIVPVDGMPTAVPQPNRVYYNVGGILQASAGWTSAVSDITFSVAWGDMNGDGWPDLAVGNSGYLSGAPNYVYLNQAGALETTPSWSSYEADGTFRVAWVDINNDGWLDLACANSPAGMSSSAPNRIYLNHAGVLETTASWVSVNHDPTLDVDAFDVDNDGDTDLFFTNGVNEGYGIPNRIYVNAYVPRPNLTNNATSVYVAAPVGIQQGNVTIVYRLTDAESDRASLRVQYSPVGGGNWLDATEGPGSEGTADLSASPAGASHVFVWNSAADAVADDSVVVRILVFQRNEKNGEFNRPALAAATRPFRVNNPNPFPEAIALSVDGDNDICYARYRPYTFSLIGYDANGQDNHDQMWLKIANSSGTTQVEIRYDRDTGLSVLQGASYISAGTPAESFPTPRQWQVDLPITFNWAMPQLVDTRLSIKLVDKDGNDSGYVEKINYLDFENRITVADADWSVNDPTPPSPGDGTLNPGVATFITYRVRYLNSDITVPDAEINYVRAIRSASYTEGTSYGLAIGQIPIITEYYTAIYTYTPRVVLNNGGGTWNPAGVSLAITTDRVEVTALSISNYEYYDPVAGRYWDDDNGSGDAMTVTVTARWYRTLAALNEGTVAVRHDDDFFANGTTSSFSAGTANASLEENPGIGIIERNNVTVDPGSAESNSYGGAVYLPWYLNLPEIGWDGLPPTMLPVDDGTYTGDNHQLSASWSASDVGSGVGKYWYAIGTAPGATDLVNWTEVFTPNVTHLFGSTLDDGMYYFSVRAVDNVGNLSNPMNSNGITVDTQPPGSFTVYDGLDASDDDYSNSATTLSANWTNASPPPSGLARYDYSIGIAPYPTAGWDSVLGGWTGNATLTSVTKSGLSLAEGQTYFFSVKAVSITGKEQIQASNGVQVDSQSPFMLSSDPVWGDLVLDTTPSVLIVLSDGLGSGIDESTLQVVLDFTTLVKDVNYTYNPGTGTISFTTPVLNLGTHVINVQASDLADNPPMNQNIVFTVENPLKVIISPNTVELEIGNTVTFLAEGGIPPYTWVASGGSGVQSGDTNHVNLAYTAGSNPGAYAVAAQDTMGVSFQARVLIQGVVSIQPAFASVSAGQTVGFTATGGTPPYSWTAGGGTLNSYSGTTVTYTAGGVGGEYALNVTDAAANSFSAQVVVTPDVGRAILVVGGGLVDDNRLVNNLNYLGNFAYQMLLLRGYTRDQIYYLNPDPTQAFDGDGDGLLNDIDGAPSPANLNAAFAWAEGEVNASVPLLVYFLDHGGQETFLLDQTPAPEVISSASVDEKLDAIQASTNAAVIFVYDACYSGSFLDDLGSASSNRVVITSTGVADGENSAYFTVGGTVSFTQYFWNNVAAGLNVMECFTRSREALAAWSGQAPKLDDNGDGTYSPDGTSKDGALAQSLRIGSAYTGGNVAPVITPCPDQNLEHGVSAMIWATVSSSFEPVAVFARITPPGYSPPGPSGNYNTPNVEDELLPRVYLTFDPTDNRWEYQFPASQVDALFTVNGRYTASFYAKDKEDNLSQPAPGQPPPTAQLIIFGPDAYEPDDEPLDASTIEVGVGFAQEHNFHDLMTLGDGSTYADWDWVKFQVPEACPYRLFTKNLGPNCDTILELYGDTIQPALATNDDYGDGKASEIFYDFTEPGLYYLKVKQYDGHVWGEGTEYELRVDDECGGLGTVSGYIRDASTSYGIEGATFKVRYAAGDSVVTTTGSGGYYLRSNVRTGTNRICLASKSPSYNDNNQLCNITTNTTINMNLTPKTSTGTLLGWVRDASGNGKGGVNLLISGSPSTTQADGFYSMRLGVGANHTLQVSAPGYLQKNFSGLVISDGGITQQDATLLLVDGDPDGDGLTNDQEVNTYGTDPLDPDTDHGGINDGDEVLIYGTDPLNPADDLVDSDGDGLLDSVENAWCTLANNADTDGDGLSDGVEDANHSGAQDPGETDPCNADTDGGGVNDGTEVNVHGTNPLNSGDDRYDPDGDGLWSYQETAWCTNPNNPDTDGDGLSDGVEDLNHNGAQDPGETNPCDADSDDDLLSDGVEFGKCISPLNPDSDGDGLSDGVEDANHNGAVNVGETDPCDADSDNDTLTDGAEVNVHGTNPLVTDSDADGLRDDVEVAGCTNALSSDSDGDGLLDGTAAGEDKNNNGVQDAGETNPCNGDSDGDGLPDNVETRTGVFVSIFNTGTNPLSTDSDSDGLNDYLEAVTVACLNPNLSDTDGDGLLDGTGSGEDQNNNGTVDAGETNPCDADSDDDGLSDGQEVLVWNTDPLDPDTDDDGLNDGPEVNTYLTNPLLADTDADGLRDDVEVAGCTNAVSSDSDGDGLLDGTSSGEDKNNNGAVDPGETDPCQADTDGDKLDDYLEAVTVACLDPLDPDTDDDGLYDGDSLGVGEDINHNGVVDPDETDPCNPDTDGDKLNDYLEAVTVACLDPLDPDTDNDGLSDGDSLGVGEDQNLNGVKEATETDPCNADTDGDIMPDGWEVSYAACVDPVVGDSLANPDGDSYTNLEEFQGGTDPCTYTGPPDADGDGLPDDWENTYACMMANTVDNLEDYDFDGLNNETEYDEGTDPCDADTDNDGASDGLEVNTALTDPLDPDSDGDLMFDGWEINAASCGLDPLFFGDAWLDSDTDTLANIHEYFNNNGDGNVSDPCDPDKPRQGWPGGGYFGDGDGNLIIGVPDLNRINLILNGRSADYINAFPADPIIQDMDGNLIIGVPDKNLISLILNGKLGGIIAGSPTELTLVEPIGGATVSEGDTVRIQVKLTKDLTKPRAGFGVVFTIVSGAGTLLGGEGISGSGRYDLTALDGVAQLVVRVDGTESILVEVALPYDPEVHTQALALTPDPSVLINVE